MKKIEKKCTPEFFEEILSGKKNFEVRLADWKCKVNDTLILKEWDPKTKTYTGRVIEKKISYVLKTKDLNFFSKKEVNTYGFQVLGLK